MKNIKVVGLRKFVLCISSVLLILGISFFAVRGFNLGIDFESGVSDTIRIDRNGVRIEEIRSALSGISARVQRQGQESDSTFIIRMFAADDDEKTSKENQVVSALGSAFGEGNVQVISSSFIGAKFSSSLITTSLVAIAVALIGILIYIWLRFQLSFSIASILTLIHDVLILLSFIVVFRIEISSITIAAILTIIGYSINNTIVIFDRIKENIKIGGLKDLNAIIDLSINQSLTRTLFSSLTTLAVVIPMGIIVLNNDIRMFSLVLSVGICIGIYSSTFVCANILRALSLSRKRLLDPMTIAEVK